MSTFDQLNVSANLKKQVSEPTYHIHAALKAL